MNLDISRPSKTEDEAHHPLKLSKQLLILPMFITIVSMVILFLGISWLIRSGQLILIQVK